MSQHPSQQQDGTAMPTTVARLARREIEQECHEPVAHFSVRLPAGQLRMRL